MNTTSNSRTKARHFAVKTATLTGAALFLIGCGSGSTLKDLETQATAGSAAVNTAPVTAATTTPPVAAAPATAAKQNTPVAAPVSATPSSTAPASTAPKPVHPLRNVKVGDCMSVAGTSASGQALARNPQPCGNLSAAAKVTKVGDAPSLGCAAGEASYSQTLTSGGVATTVSLCLAKASDRNNVLALGSCMQTNPGSTATTVTVTERNCADPAANAVVASAAAASAKCPAGALYEIDQKSNEVAGALGYWCVRTK